MRGVGETPEERYATLERIARALERIAGCMERSEAEGEKVKAMIEAKLAEEGEE